MPPPWWEAGCRAGFLIRHFPTRFLLPLAPQARGWFGDGALSLVFRAGRRSCATVTITEDTKYPFEETIRLRINPERPVTFPLFLRLPGWCSSPVIRLNGEALSCSALPEHYLRLERRWQADDRIEIQLPMDTRVHTWTKNFNTVSVWRGPLTYSLKIKERYVRSGGTDRWPAYDIFPDSPWNYGLVLDPGNPAASFTFEQRAWPADDQPWEAEAAPCRIHARGKRIPQWQLDEHGLVREVQAGPVRSDQPVEPITLIPMGAARLRISAFPVIGDGPDAHTWKIPEPPPVRASHCWEGDSVGAVCDDKVPARSNDQSIPRFTWWPRQGSREWIERDFKQPRTISRVAVYWFDDTGQGGCRVPASWTLLYRDDGQWKPVTGASAFGVARDRFNEVTFDPVKTDGLRLEAQLQPGFSGGILEWRAE